MLNKKYLKRIMKLLRAYESCLDGYRLIISTNQAEFKLSYKKGKDFTESVWIANDGNISSVYYSIENELRNKYPYVNFN